MSGRKAALCVLLVAAGCLPSVETRVGVSVPVDEIHPARDRLRSWIAGELGQRQIERAFFALEVLKTRRYAAQRLAARARPAGGGTDSLAQVDLRDVFAEVFAPEGATETDGPALVASRGLERVSAGAAAALASHDSAGDAAFWDDLRLYQLRLQHSVPYLHAVRNSFAVTTTKEARLMLAPEDLALSFFVHDGRVHLFVLRPGGVSVHTLKASAATLRDLTRRLLEAVNHPPADRVSWRPAAGRLYDALLAPIAAELRDERVRHLYIVPDGFIANVPFSILQRPAAAGRQLLLERVRITYLPSLTVYRRLMMRDILARPPSMLAVGNPAFSVPVPVLPSAETEARVVSGVFDEALLLTGSEARESRVAKQVENYNILHFATHGVLLGDRVPGGSSLLVASDEGHDGFLSAAEIVGLDLSHIYLAVLSACETSVGSGEGESLDVGSLTGAFLAAGAPTVVGSLWKVSDDSTTELLLSFYSQFLERGAGDALRAAQLEIRSKPRFAHPYYWAAFVLYGWDK